LLRFGGGWPIADESPNRINYSSAPSSAIAHLREELENEMDITTTERRRNRRYELRLPLHYRVANKGSLPLSGSGNTCDLSSSGLSFRCRRPLPVGAHIEIVVDWPSKYADLYPIELHVTGFIVRSLGGRIGVRVSSRKLRVDSALEQPYRATA
jgi:hypothetical protein